MAIERIGILMTAPDLYDRQDTPTGDVFVDGVVSVLRDSKHPTVTQIAELLGVDKNALSKIIEVRVGRNLNGLVDYWKWRKIEHLLTETEMPFDEVAHECGLSGYTSLHRFVERMVSKTPVEMRQRCKRRRWKQNQGYISIVKSISR